MSFGDARLDAALDRHITGNWGEDQFKGQEEWENFVEKICSECLCEKWCPVVEKFYNGDDDLYDHPCLVLKGIMEVNEQSEYNMEMEREFQEMERDYWIEEAGAFISNDPVENWENNQIQFARLIAECEAVGAITITQELCDSMDLDAAHIEEIIERAQSSFEKMKEQLRNKRSSFGNTEIEKLIEDKIEKGIAEDARLSGY